MGAAGLQGSPGQSLVDYIFARILIGYTGRPVSLTGALNVSKLALVYDGDPG